MKQFVKVLKHDSLCSVYNCHKMTVFIIEKIKSGIFDGPQIRQPINDPLSEQSMNEGE